MGDKVVHTSLPQRPGSRFLDIGCGTGIVTLDLARVHPEAEVIGVDFSPVPVEASSKPANVDFIQANVLKLPPDLEHRFQLGSYDFIFHRLLFGGMNTWPEYMAGVTRLLKPGGTVEMQDLDFEYISAEEGKEGDVISKQWKWFQAFEQAGKEMGLDLRAGRQIARWMKEAGLVNVSREEYVVPLSPWMTETNPQTEKFGRYWDSVEENLVRGLIERMFGESATKEELANLLEDVSTTLKNKGNCFFVMYVTTGHKAE